MISREKIKTGPKNSLVITGYSDDTGGKPYKLTLDGVWTLTGDHDLSFRVLGSDVPFTGKTLIMRGDVEDVRGDALIFRVRRFENIRGARSSTITLGGRWRADDNNRINFEVDRGKGLYDTLTFQGSWEVGKNNELIYKYRKTDLKRKSRIEKEIAFGGWWEIAKNKLTYCFEYSPGSFFTFNASLALPEKISFLDKVLPYEVGVSYAIRDGLRRVQKTVSIKGKWEISKDLDVSFCADYAGGRLKKTEFGLSKIVRNKGAVSFLLEDRCGEGLALKAEIKKVIQKDAELFLALSHSGRENSIMGGARVKF